MSSAIEQLRVAHHLALRAQHTSGFDAAALVRAWPQIASAAHAAHEGLGLSPTIGSRIIERISLDGLSLALAAGGKTWPGPGDRDPALLQVSAALFTASRVAGTAPVDPHDRLEAQRLIVSSLWTTSRIVGHAARDHSFDVRFTTSGDDKSRAAISSTAKDTYRRLNAIEQLSASALGAPGPGADGSRGVGAHLGQAVAEWDIEAHRALLGHRSTAVLHVLSHLETETVKALQYLIAQAAGANIVDHVTSDRLLPILADSSTSWETLRDASAQLSFASTAVPMRFIDTARNLQSALAATSRLATNDDQPDILRAISSHLNSTVTISATARDLIESSELRAPARAISRLLAEQPASPINSLASPVDPVAIYRGQSLPLDNATRRILDEPARRVFLDAHEAVNRASGLDSLYRSDPHHISEPHPPPQHREVGAKSAPPRMTTPGQNRSPSR